MDIMSVCFILVRLSFLKLNLQGENYEYLDNGKNYFLRASLFYR